MNIFKDERIDDLQINSLQLIQNTKKYCFTTDAVLLANFARVKRGDVVADLCSGSGVVPILIQGKSAFSNAVITVEVDEYFCDLIKRNCLLNHMSFEVICDKVQDSIKILQDRQVNVITVNPPYEKLGSGIDCQNHAIARQEILLTLEELISCSAKVLQKGGRFYMVHKSCRLAEIMYLMGKYRLIAKQIRFVRGKLHKQPHLVLIEAIKDGGYQLTLQHDLILQNDDGSETCEIKNIYQRKEI